MGQAICGVAPPSVAVITVGRRDVGSGALSYWRLRVRWVTPLGLFTASIWKRSSTASRPSQSRSPRPQHDRHHDDVQVVDKVGRQELADGGRAAADADIRSGGGLTRLRKRLGGAGVEEVEAGTAVHLDGWPGMVGEDKDRSVERRGVSPPSVPLPVPRQ